MEKECTCSNSITSRRRQCISSCSVSPGLVSEVTNFNKTVPSTTFKVGNIFEQMLKTLEQMSVDKHSSPPTVEEKKVPSSVPSSVRVILPPPDKDGSTPSLARESYEPSAQLFK